MSKSCASKKNTDFASELRVIDLYVTEISVQHGEQYDHRSTNHSKTFSRFNWSNQPSSILIKDSADPNENKPFLVRFRINTVTKIGLGESVPSDVEIPAEKMLGTIALSFAIEYLTSTDPRLVDPDKILQIEQSKVLDDVWPYWRESLQNLALRAKFPVPILPLRGTLPGYSPPETDKLLVAKKSRRTAKKISSE